MHVHFSCRGCLPLCLHLVLCVFFPCILSVPPFFLLIILSIFFFISLLIFIEAAVLSFCSTFFVPILSPVFCLKLSRLLVTSLCLCCSRCQSPILLSGLPGYLLSCFPVCLLLEPQCSDSALISIRHPKQPSTASAAKFGFILPLADSALFLCFDHRSAD